MQKDRLLAQRVRPHVSLYELNRSLDEKAGILTRQHSKRLTVAGTVKVFHLIPSSVEQLKKGVQR